MFIGANLQKVRVLYGYSRKELGEALNVSEQAVWQFENQMTTPSFETIVALKRLFSVKTAYFYQEKKAMVVVKEENIAYREADIVSRKKTTAEAEYLNTIYPIISTIESYLDVPKGNIQQIRDTILSCYYSSEEITRVEVQQMAEQAREMLDISLDNSDLLYKIEKSGVHIVEKNIGGKADAYSTWNEDRQTAFIVLGKRKSAVRRNFDLAHELGHLLMHVDREFLSLDKNEYNKLEAEANMFASFFLLPEKEFLQDFSKLNYISNPDSYVELKMKYHVSIQALEMRAYKLGLLTPQQNTYFYRQIAKKDYRKKEPLDEEMILKRPGKIRSIMQLVFSNQLLSLADFLEDLHVETDYVSKLFTIEKDFFSPFQNNESFSDYGKILPAQFK